MLSLSCTCSLDVNSVGAGWWINLPDSASNEVATSRENIADDFTFFLQKQNNPSEQTAPLELPVPVCPRHCSQSLEGEQLLIPILLLYLPELFPALYLSTTAQTHRGRQALKGCGFQSELSA